MNNFILYKYKMSLLPTDVYTNNFQTISNISQTLSSLYINNSTITTNHIVLDNNNLDTTGSGGTASLLLNGVAVASASGLTSSIANWAQFGANSTITYATGGGTGGSIIMCNGYFSNTSTTGATTQALTVSTINGQTIAGLGQTIAYRPVSYLSSQTFNSGTTPAIVLTSFSNAVGKNVAGSLNMTLGGYAGISNSSGTIPYMGVFVTDNNSSPYTPTSALGGTQIADWYLFGPNTNPGTGAGTVPPNDVVLSYAFSNAGSNLYVCALANNSFGSINWSAGGTQSISTGLLAIYGGGTVLAV
jgi:hypothetical protein